MCKIIHLCRTFYDCAHDAAYLQIYSCGRAGDCEAKSVQHGMEALHRMPIINGVCDAHSSMVAFSAMFISRLSLDWRVLISLCGLACTNELTVKTSWAGLDSDLQPAALKILWLTVMVTTLFILP